MGDPQCCQVCLSQPSVCFLGQLVDEMGIIPDPEQVRTVLAMKEPTNISELCQFLDMVNQLAKGFPMYGQDNQAPL